MSLKLKVWRIMRLPPPLIPRAQLPDPTQNSGERASTHDNEGRIYVIVSDGVVWRYEHSGVAVE